MEPETNTDYARKDYWEARYRDESARNVHAFEWLKGWEFYREAVALVINKTAKILHLGCGNSRLSPDMYTDGYLDQENIDFSEVVIEDMRASHADKPEIKWTVADIFRMGETLPASSYDAVIDKGTLDAFLTGWPDEDPWDPSPACLAQCNDYMRQVEKVMKPRTGIFVQITWSQPHFRKKFLEVTGNLDVEVKKVGTEWEFFVFVCRWKDRGNGGEPAI